jgi:acyl carrier protein
MDIREDNVRESTFAILAEIAEVELAGIRGTDRLREDLGMDSLSSLELLSSLGEKLQVDLEIEEAMDIRTVDDACAFVERQYRQARA